MHDVIVVGAGLAGSSAALQLARRGFSVLLLEKQRYPAHKLCGEFLSVEVQDAFERLGVWPAVRAAGACPIDHTCVTTADGSSFEQPLPGVAWGLSRYRLDALLFEAAQQAGATVRDGAAVRTLAGSLRDGFVAETDADAYPGRVVLCAYGKRDRLDRQLGRGFLRQQSPYVGFKAHYEGLRMDRRIELHAFPGGYCGLSPIEDGRVNACWITHQHALQAAGGSPEAMIEHVFSANAALAGRFRQMHRVMPAFKAVGQVTFRRKQPFEGDLCMLGDTAGMIAPLCGDGMAMALQSAELAVPAVAGVLEGRLTPAAYRAAYTSAWRQAFGLRMNLGRWIHHAYCRPRWARLGVQACVRLPGLAQWVIRNTRG